MTRNLKRRKAVFEKNRFLRLILYRVRYRDVCNLKVINSFIIPHTQIRRWRNGSHGERKNAENHYKN